MTEVDATAVALSLYSNIHSAANENVLTSLIAAAFNECEKFRRWFIRDQTNLDKRIDGSRYRATANEQLPKILRGKKGARAQQYVYPDLVLWDLQEADKWDNIPEMKTLSKNARAGLGENKLHAVFVEVKWDCVSEKDKDKYIHFINVIRNVEKEMGARKLLHFVLLVCLQDAVLKRLRKRANCGWENPLHELLNTDGVTVLTHDEIFDALVRSVYRVKNSKKYPATHVAKEYLRLLVEPTAKEWWNYVLREPGYSTEEDRLKGLRDEIVEATRHLCVRAGVVDKWPQRPKWRPFGRASINMDDWRMHFNLEDKTLIVSGSPLNEPVRFNLGAKRPRPGRIIDGLETIDRALQSSSATYKG